MSWVADDGRTADIEMGADVVAADDDQVGPTQDVSGYDYVGKSRAAVGHRCGRCYDCCCSPGLGRKRRSTNYPLKFPHLNRSSAIQGR